MSNKKIGVGILGATGSVGQKFIALLEDHPLFEVAEVAASERSAGKPYSEAANWALATPLPKRVAAMTVKMCEPGLESKLVFSGLDSSVAGGIETELAESGYIVVSNSRNHRMDPDVPLLIPEVNPDHLELLKLQNYKGAIVTNPNCSTIGLVTALKPLQDAFGLEAVNVVTMQALSGGGYPGVSSMDILDNVLPYIGGEEDKIETEPLKLLGSLKDGGIEFASFPISAQCNRVAVLDGHLETVQVKLKKKAAPEELIAALRNFTAEPQRLGLPTAPEKPVVYFDEPNYPQPKLHRDLGGGMTVSVGRLRECPLFDYKFVALSHNTVRGAAGGAILNAELMHHKGYLNV